MADYNVNMKQWNGTSFDNVLPLAYNAKQLEGQSLAEVEQWVQDNNLLLYTGQHTGTGTYGASHPTSITFPFNPIIFFFLSGGSTGRYTKYNPAYPIITNCLSTDYVEDTFFEPESSVYISMKKSSDGKTISFYGEDASAQQNNSGDIYYFAAIGGYDMGGGVTEWLITSSGSWTVPRTGRYMLELYGGGGGTVRRSYYQGGSSCQVYDSITLTKGTSIQVIIGQGMSENSGGSTSFGSYSVSGGGLGELNTGGNGAGNKGTDGQYASYSTKKLSNGTLGSTYGFGENASSSSGFGTGGPGAVYLKYLGA